MQFLFKLPDGSRYVHCGDMRYCPAMQDNAQLQRFVGADAVFLDTTYCKGKHQFPPQVGYCSGVLQHVLLIPKLDKGGICHCELSRVAE